MKKGFTLIEAILYLAIAGTVLYFISGFAFNAIFGKSKIETIQDVSQTNQTVLDEMGSTIGTAADINGYSYSDESAVAGSNIPTDSLMSYWSFDGDMLDHYQGINDGTCSSCPTLTTGVKGLANTAYSFNGSDNYISTGLTIPTTDFAISMWYYPNDNGGGYTIRPFGSGDSGGGSHGLDFTVSNGGGSTWIIFRNNGGSYDFDCGASPAVGVWEHLVISVSSVDGATCYRGGDIFGSNVDAKSISTGGLTFKIGSSGDGGTPFNGSIDNVRIYSRVLLPEEVRTIFTEEGQ